MDEVVGWNERTTSSDPTVKLPKELLAVVLFLLLFYSLTSLFLPSHDEYIMSKRRINDNA